MSDHKKIASEIENLFQSYGYPADFTETYDQMECMASHAGRETFLVRNKENGAYAIAKCYDKSLYALAPETDILRGLENPGIPKITDHYENDTMLCLVRDYVEGKPLNEYVRDNELSQKEALSIGSKLADILIYLHGQEKPIIHRDVKPENIILQQDGNVVLIDFDIARTVKEESESDTLFFGTRGYAPPEQYGFEQTDQRADIYSFGVLLRFLLTGKSRQAKNITLQPDLQHIIDKCTAFSPKDRYDSMTAVKKALQNVRPVRTTDRKKRLIALAASLLAMLCIGFVLGRYTDFLKPSPGITFQEPLIEQAVRLQLGLSDKENIQPEDLQKVREIYIFGMSVFKMQEDMNDCRPDSYTRGNVKTLADIKLLPNLEHLCVSYQGEMDISALPDARFLNSLNLGHTRIADISPLGECMELDSIILFDSGISDCTVLENCPRLSRLDIGQTPIASFSEIGIIPQLEELNLNWMHMDNLNGIEQMPKIERLWLGDAEIGDMSALLLLPKLKEVYTDESNRAALTELFAGRDVEIIVE